MAALNEEVHRERVGRERAQAETLRALEDTVGRLRSEHGHERRAREASEAHILQLLRDAITHQSHLQRSLLE